MGEPVPRTKLELGKLNEIIAGPLSVADPTIESKFWEEWKSRGQCSSKTQSLRVAIMRKSIKVIASFGSDLI